MTAVGAPARLMVSAMMQERVIGQADAVSAVPRAMKRARRRPEGPAPPHRGHALRGAHRRRQDRAQPRCLRPPRSCECKIGLATPALQQCLVPTAALRLVSSIAGRWMYVDWNHT